MPLASAGLNYEPTEDELEYSNAGEDEFLARLCSGTPNALTLGLAAVTQMFGPGYGKGFRDCLMEMGASPSKAQVKAGRSRELKGRISLGILHAVGDKARRWANAGQVYIPWQSSPWSREEWDELDSPEWWASKYEDSEHTNGVIFRERYLASLPKCWSLQVEEYARTTQVAYDIAGSNRVLHVGFIVLAARILNSKSGANVRREIERCARSRSPLESLASYYSSWDGRKPERVKFILEMLEPYQFSSGPDWMVANLHASEGSLCGPAVVATVGDVQTALKSLGMYDGAIDGKVGPKSKAAVRQWCRIRSISFTPLNHHLILPVVRRTLSRFA